MIRLTAALRTRSCTIALAISLAGVTPALAQQTTPDDQASATTEDDAEEAIVVTGSRIVSGFDRPTPVSVLGAARLEERGATNLGDALNELPAFRATNTPASTGLGAAGGYVGGRIL